MSKGKPSHPQPPALLVLGDTAAALQKQALKKFQGYTIDALELIARGERLNVHRRIAAGIALLIVKERLAHTEFMPWLKKHVTSGGYTQCTYMMRAARAFLAATELSRADLLTFTSNTATLQLGKKVQTSKLVISIANFCGDLSWTELLEHLEIRDVPNLGGARKPGTKPGTTTQDAEQLYLFAVDEIGSVITKAETVLITENQLQHLASHPQELAGVVVSLRALADKVEAAAKPYLKK